jgi:hypothetical protein
MKAGCILARHKFIEHVSYSAMKIDQSTSQDSRRSTVRDVAGLAGVSMATVSRVMNDPGIVSDETRERVLRSISRLKYLPNVHAAKLGRANRGIPKRHGN